MKRYVHERNLIFYARWVTFSIILVVYPLAHFIPGTQLPARVRMGSVDFGQYYMAGTAARLGMWDEMYPQKAPSACYPECHERGLVGNECPVIHGSIAFNHTFGMVHPKLAASAPSSARWRTLNIYPPPTALLLTPLSLLSFDQAVIVWKILGLLATAWLVWIAGWSVRLFMKRPTWQEAALLFFFTTGIIPYANLACGNISVFLAILSAAALWAWTNAKPSLLAVSVAIPTLLKGITISWVPIFPLAHRWKVVLWGAGITFFVAILSYTLMGFDPFRVYLFEVLPNIGHHSGLSFFTKPIPHLPGMYVEGAGNQSLLAVTARLSRNSFFSPIQLQLVNLAKYLLLMLVYILFYRVYRRPVSQRPCEPVIISATFATLLALFNIFNPICWEHYTLLLVPFWGWLSWEATQTKTLTGPLLIALTFLLIWMPMRVLSLNNLLILGYSQRAFGYALIASFGIRRLWISQQLTQRLTT